ncbi:hypothetical protein CB1_001640002 [Camelus ferus]|nr:hypothetical protein CB1_001640002 [Camelus ferus]
MAAQIGEREARVERCEVASQRAVVTDNAGELGQILKELTVTMQSPAGGTRGADPALRQMVALRLPPPRALRAHKTSQLAGAMCVGSKGGSGHEDAVITRHLGCRGTAGLLPHVTGLDNVKMCYVGVSARSTRRAGTRSYDVAGYLIREEM